MNATIGLAVTIGNTPDGRLQLGTLIVNDQVYGYTVERFGERPAPALPDLAERIREAIVLAGGQAS